MSQNNHAFGGNYLDMPLQLDTADEANCEYFKHCANGQFHLQACDSCALLRYPPTTACPWCGHGASTFKPVDAKGRVYTYAEVHHAIQPAFKPYLPYSILIVELTTQRDQPGPNDALRVSGNLATPEGELASVDDVSRIGIGSAVRMVFKSVTNDFALPLWTLDESDETNVQSAKNRSLPWRYPE